MKTKKCWYCKQEKEDKKELWATFYCCHDCANNSKQALKKIFEEGQWREGTEDLIRSKFGFGAKKSQETINKTTKDLANPKKRLKIYKKLRKQGLSDEEIWEGWRAFGIKKE